MIDTREGYKDWIRRVLEAAKRDPSPTAVKDAMVYLSLHSVFFLLVYILGRKDADKDWVWDRCMEVQKDPDGYLDIWAREHYKSTIVTFAMTIMDICKDPEIKAVIYSYNRPIAKAFLRQIKVELETNATLKWLFPDVLWDDPKKQAPKWSEDTGLIVKRKGNPKESTLEAYGLVDGQPTSRHYSLIIYDDVVTKESTSNPEMIDKVTYAWELSLNTGSEGCRKRYVGTRYHYADTYHVIENRGAAIPRIYPCIDENGESVLFPQEYIAHKRRDMGSYTFACQMLCNPKQEGDIGFSEKDLRYWDPSTLETLNVYIIVDPANTKKKKSDYTGIWVIGVGADENYYVLTMVRDKLSLTERTRILFSLHQQYHPLNTFYERYGMQSDIEHIKYVQKQTNYRFSIQPFGGKMGKKDRILTLTPLFEANRIYLPTRCMRKNWEGRTEDLTAVFIRDEYLAFPFCHHDDMIDALARIADEEVSKSIVFPDPLSVISIIEQAMGYKGAGEESLEEYNPLA